MKLFLVLIVLLCESLTGTDAIRPKKCFNNVTGFCRKRCKIGETSDVGCLGGRYCCVKEQENKRYQQAQQPARPPMKELQKEEMDYFIMPTVTVVTINL